MKLDDDMDRRLQNWARYLHTLRDGGGDYARATLQERVDGQGWDAPTVIPTNAAEAEETHAGVMQLPGELRAATEAWYLAGGGVAHKCARLCISETTLRQRVGLAHRRLAQWLTDKQQQARQMRERVEALQTAARGRVTG